jgi:putative MATE family efflux protein
MEAKKSSGIERMKTAPVGTAIIRMALPMIAAMVAQSIYNMTDLFFIGQTGDPNMVAAVSLAFPLFMLSQCLGTIFAVGSSTYISRCLGEKNTVEARYANSVSFYIVFFAGLVLAAVLWIFKTPILQLIGTSESTFTHTDGYFSVVVLFMAFAAAANALGGQMRSEGATDKAMILQMSGIVLNIILDPIFILYFDWGTAGAAWATVAGQILSFSYGVWYFLSKKTNLLINPFDYKPNKTMLFQMLSIGVPAGLSFLIMSVSNILGNRIASSYGDHVIAGNGVQMRITSFIFMIILGLNNGYQPFAGYNYGAKQFERFRKGFKLTLLYGIILCSIGCVLLLVFGDTIIRFFINDAKTIEAGAAMLRVFVCGLPFFSLQVTLMTTFQALGKPIESTIITLGRQLLFYVPLLYLLNYFFGFSGFIWAQPAADILTTGIAVMLSRSLFRIMRNE